MGILFSIFLIGFTAMSLQIVILREMLVVFYGNEISIGFILGSWLFWGAAGSWFLGRFSDKVKSRLFLLSLCQLASAFLPVLSILAIRSIKTYLGLAPGELIGFIPMALSSFFVLAPICALLGFMFSLGCKIYISNPADRARDIGLAYGWESAGAMLGGALTSIIFVRCLNPLIICVLVGLMNVAVSFLLLFKRDKRAVFPLLVFIAAVFLWLSGTWKSLDEHALERQWEGYRILGAENSVYGNVMVTRKGRQYSFFDNGLHLYSLPDEQGAEEAVHFALLQQANPQEVLLIGGGVGGLAGEILRYPVKSLDYLELDPLIIKMAARYLPDEEYSSLRDIRVSIYNLDGRFFLKSTRKKYDCVITHLGDPYTAQINRYYTVEFFKEVKSVLNKNGIFSFYLSASENYISPESGEYLRSVYLGLKKAFEEVLVVPGDNVYFLASDKPGVISLDYCLLEKKSREKGLDLKYVREYYLFSRLSPQLIAYTEGVLTRKTGTRLNYDFWPSTYYYNMIFWAARLGDTGFKDILKGVDYRRMIYALWAACLLIVIFGFFQLHKGADPYKNVSLMALMSTGFSVMAIQVIVLLAFQIIYGYIFYKVGFLLTVFMAGLAGGSFWAFRALERSDRPLDILLSVIFLLCVLTLGMPVLFSRMAMTGNAVLSAIGADVVFPFLSAVSGLLAGMGFPAVNKICLKENNRVGRVAGLTYGIDLLGSCLGALASGIIFIPVLGVTRSCLAVSAVNFSILAVLVFARRKF
ncbi:MAG: fused MFS/spermidine synthase [Candidatus Omnitrophica bacterium]|nr:fused MFS/spermidine synthase [Candidatus Omnitrophota bacterium]